MFKWHSLSSGANLRYCAVASIWRYYTTPPIVFVQSLVAFRISLHPVIDTVVYRTVS